MFAFGALVAEHHGEREKGPARMIDADKSPMSDDVGRLPRAIIGMGAPGNIGQQTGRVAQTLLLEGFVEPRDAMKASVHVEQFFAVGAAARQQRALFARGARGADRRRCAAADNCS